MPSTVSPPPAPAPPRPAAGGGGAAVAEPPAAVPATDDAARCASNCACARGESAAQQSPGPSTSRNCCPAVPETYLMSEKLAGGATSDPDVMPTLFAFAITLCVSGS